MNNSGASPNPPSIDLTGKYPQMSDFFKFKDASLKQSNLQKMMVIPALIFETNDCSYIENKLKYSDLKNLPLY